MKTFTLYRNQVAVMEGVVFSDGHVAARWLAPPPGGKTWDSYEDFHAVHIAPHPDYDVAIVWRGLPVVEDLSGAPA